MNSVEQEGRRPERDEEESVEEVGDLGTGGSGPSAGTEPLDEDEPGVVGGSDQGAHAGSLGGERPPEPFPGEPQQEGN